ncbi:MAG TPA: AgmX/PglI C-terminal domain-containing protein [Polyangiaceae bacterium]
MPHARALGAVARFALGLACAAALTACGGSEPPPKVAEEQPKEEPMDHGATSVSAEIGGLNETKVDATFQSAIDGLQDCLNSGAKRVEFLGGSVSFFVKINSKGRVDHAHLEKSTLGDRDTEKCMLQALRAKKWPRPVGGQHGLARKSFDFDPPNDVRAPTNWDSEHVSKEMGKLAHKLNACKSDSKGQYEATLYVGTDGSVLSASVTPPDEAGEQDVDCLVDLLRSASLPSPGSWPAKVTFSL